MYSFFKRDRLLLTLLVLFGLFFGILGAVLKYTGDTTDPKAPAIAYGFRALHDGVAKKAKSQTQEQMSAGEIKSDTATVTESESEPADESPFRTVDESYFTDALFIGDARVDGLRLYAPFDGADYFCSTEMTLTDCMEVKIEVEGRGETTLPQLLSHRRYGKIYISLGINEMGYDLDYLVNQFDTVYEALREAEPDAIIYIMANLHVTKSYADAEAIFQSDRVDDLNRRFAEYADGLHSYYINENEIFDDAEGYLVSSYTEDETLLSGKYYKLWADFICRNAAKEKEE